MPGALPDQEITTALSELAKLKAARDRAHDGCERIFERLASQGFGRRAVSKALDLLDSGAQESFEDLLQAQAILQALKAPVQIELPSLYETPVTDDVMLASFRDEGYWARVCGADRVYKAQDEQKRRAWMEGWDEADGVLSVNASQPSQGF